MHSADYAVARCPSVRPSVCVSHAGILSKRINVSSKFFYRTILVLSYQAVRQFSDENGGVELRGYKKRDFRPISRFISKLVQDTAIVTMECE